MAVRFTPKDVETSGVRFKPKEQPKKNFLDVVKDRAGFDPYTTIAKTVTGTAGVPGIDRALESSKSSAFSYANQRLLNMPRALLTSAGYDMPEENTGSRIAGFIGGAQSIGGNIPKMVATKTVSIPRLIAQKTTGRTSGVAKGISQFFTKPSLLKSMAQGGISGGIVAPLYTETDKPFDIKGRISRIPMGVSAGATLGMAGYGVSKVGGALGKAFAKRNAAGQKKDIGATLKPTQILLEDKVRRRAERIKSIGEKRLQPVKEKLARVKESKQMAQAKFARKQALATEDFQKYNDNAKKELFRISEKTGESFKKNINAFRRSFGDTYGTYVDKAAAELADSGDEILRSDIDNLFQKTMSELADEGREIPSKLKNLAKQYAMETVDEATGEITEIIDEPIKLRKLLNEMKQLTEGKENIFKGTQRAKSAQGSMLTLKKNLGEYVAGKSETFAQLQKESRPVLEKLKLLSKATKPGSLETKPATTFAKSYAKSVAEGTPDKFTKEAVTMLEDGVKVLSEDIKGYGKFTDQAISATKQVAKKPSTANFREAHNDQIARLTKYAEGIEKDTKARLAKAKGTGFLGEARINALKKKAKEASDLRNKISHWGERIVATVVVYDTINRLKRLGSDR